MDKRRHVLAMAHKRFVSMGITIDVSDRKPVTDPQDPPKQDLRADIAVNAPGMSAADRMKLAADLTPDDKGRVACYSDNLSAAQRMELAAQATPEWRARVATQCKGLSLEQRLSLSKDAPACCPGMGYGMRDPKPPPAQQPSPGTPQWSPPNSGLAPFRVK